MQVQRYHHHVCVHLKYISCCLYYLNIFTLVEDVDVSNIMLTSVEVTWRIPYIFEMESYTVEYGLSFSELNQVSDVVLSPNDPT